MRFRPPLPLLLAILAACSVAMTTAAAHARKMEAGLAAAAFAATLIVATLATNRALWHPTSAAAPMPATPRAAIFAAALLTMTAYVWGGVTLLAIYLGAGVSWQHGWQYGGLMLIAGAGHAVYLMRLADPKSAAASARALDTASKLAALQAVAVAGALVWLVASGKVSSVKGDWAANQIFLAGGFAIICISLVAVRAHAALTRAGD
jgi:hypothetical protein